MLQGTSCLGCKNRLIAGRAFLRHSRSRREGVQAPCAGAHKRHRPNRMSHLVLARDKLDAGQSEWNQTQCCNVRVAPQWPGTCATCCDVFNTILMTSFLIDQHRSWLDV